MYYWNNYYQPTNSAYQTNPQRPYMTYQPQHAYSPNQTSQHQVPCNDYQNQEETDNENNQKEMVNDQNEVQQPYFYPNSNHQMNDLGLLQQITALHQKLEKIAQENEELKKQVENIKPINIENINYKIQELTVEELSGNLMIGMTAFGDSEDLKNLLNEKGNIQFNDIDTENVEQQMEDPEFDNEG